MNLAHILERHVTERGGKIALIDGQRQLTYQEFESRVGHVAAYLRSLGLQKGSRVLVFVPMSTNLYVLLLAVFRMGAVAVFVDPGMTKSTINSAVETAQPHAFIGIAKAHLLRLFCPAIRRIPIKRTASTKRIEKWSAANHPHSAVEPVDAEDGALLTFTSGSTGQPKGVLRSHGALLAQHEALADVLGTREDDVDLPGLPIVLLNTLAAGATAVIPPIGSRVEHTDPQVLYRLFESHHITTSAGSPALYRGMVDFCREHRKSLPNVRRVFIGGAPVPPSLLQDMATVIPNGDSCVVYGSTEAEPISHVEGQHVLAETVRDTARGAGLCVGEPVDCVRVRLDDGEILVAGDHVNRSYYKNTAAVEQFKVADEDGTVWHRTGDVGRIDDRGRLWLLGRRGDSVERNGETLYATSLEMAARCRAGVSQAAFLDLNGNTTLVVEGADPDVEALQALHPAIDNVVVMAKIPTDRRHNAKIDYVALRNHLLD